MQLKSFSENRTYGVSSALGCYAEQGCFFLSFLFSSPTQQPGLYAKCCFKSEHTKVRKTWVQLSRSLKSNEERKT